MTVERNAPLDIDSDTVDIWLTSLAAVDDDLLASYVPLLSEDERVRWQRFLVRAASDQYLAGRALLRTTLSRYAPVPEDAWVFETNAYGCPSVSAPAAWRELRFNLSHTAGLVVCAVTRQSEIGVDVENTARNIDPLELAPTVFASREVADVAARTPEDRRQRFFAYWTLKEAYIKARGMGISLPLDGFWFDLAGASPRIEFGESCPDRPERWHFSRCQPTPSHAMAVAVATATRQAPRIRLRWILPAAPAGARPPERHLRGDRGGAG